MKFLQSLFGKQLQRFDWDALNAQHITEFDFIAYTGVLAERPGSDGWLDQIPTISMVFDVAQLETNTPRGQTSLTCAIRLRQHRNNWSEFIDADCQYTYRLIEFKGVKVIFLLLEYLALPRTDRYFLFAFPMQPDLQELFQWLTVLSRCRRLAVLNGSTESTVSALHFEFSEKIQASLGRCLADWG